MKHRHSQLDRRLAESASQPHQRIPPLQEAAARPRMLPIVFDRQRNLLLAQERARPTRIHVSTSREFLSGLVLDGKSLGPLPMHDRIVYVLPTARHIRLQECGYESFQKNVASWQTPSVLLRAYIHPAEEGVFDNEK